MTKTTINRRQGPRLALTMALGVTLVAALAAPMHALAAEAEATTTSAEPFATEEWRHQQQMLEPGQTFATEEWQLEQKRQPPQTGRATRGWLQTQSNREQASANRPTLSGPALRRVHDRYLRSFDPDIPQQLRESLPGNK